MTRHHLANDALAKTRYGRSQRSVFFFPLAAWLPGVIRCKTVTKYFRGCTYLACRFRAAAAAAMCWGMGNERKVLASDQNQTGPRKKKEKKKKSPGRTITRSAVESVVRETRHKLLEPRAKAKARSQNRCPGSQRRPRTECSQGEDACEGGRFGLPSSHG